MQECFQKFPELYKDYEDSDEGEGETATGRDDGEGNAVMGRQEGGREVMTGREKMTEQTKSPTVSGSSKQLTSSSVS